MVHQHRHVPPLRDLADGLPLRQIPAPVRRLPPFEAKARSRVFQLYIILSAEADRFKIIQNARLRLQRRGGLQYVLHCGPQRFFSCKDLVQSLHRRILRNILYPDPL